jgi:hypothetical protein
VFDSSYYILIRNDVGILEGVRARESLFIEIERTKQIPCCDIMTRAVLALYIKFIYS